MSWGRPVVGLMVAAMVTLAPSSGAAAAANDVCLEVGSGLLNADEWSAVAEAVAVVVTSRPALFPAPAIDDRGMRLDIDAGQPEAEKGEGSACLEAGFEWTVRFGRDFLQAGADRLLAEAPTTPGIDSAIDIEWYPDERRVRTTLAFAGPLDIPNGTCWVDDRLTVSDGAVVASGEQGLSTSPFAEGACGRFFDHLPHGGAGEQAVTLLPARVQLPAGSSWFRADVVFVHGEGLAVAGSLVREQAD